MMITQEEVTKLPTTKNENYKYTNVQKLFAEDIAVGGAPTVELEDDKFYTDAHNLIFLNGTLQHQHLEGVKIGALKDYSSDLLERVNMTIDDPLLLLNQKYSHSACVIEVDAKIDKPLVLQHFYDGVKGNLIASHLVIWIKSGALDLLELDHGLEQDSFIRSRVVSVVVEKNAACHHTKVNTLKPQQHTLDTTTAKVYGGALYDHVLLNAGGGVSRHNYFINLEAPLAHADVYGLYATKNEEHVDNYISIHHKAPLTTSDQIFKGTLDDTSRGIFTGLVRVEKHAQQINAKQLNKNLLLSNQAKAHSRPQLEIFADDVKCSHGSTTGQLSPEEMFYFASRGIKPEVARRMLIRAMGEDILLKIKNPLVKQIVEDLVQDHMAT